MEQPTKEEVQKMQKGSQRLFLWKSRELFNAVCDGYLALREEVKAKEATLDRYRESARLLNRKRVALEADNQELKARYMQAINDEPELPGPMPDGMREDVLANPEEAMRVVVRATKKGILERIENL